MSEKGAGIGREKECGGRGMGIKPVLDRAKKL